MFELTVTKPSTPTPAAAAIRVTDIRRKGNAEIESQTMGVICIRDVFLPEDDNNKDKDKNKPVLKMVSKMFFYIEYSNEMRGSSSPDRCCSFLLLLPLLLLFHRSTLSCLHLP